MQSATNTGTEVPAHKGAGFPPFKTETYPSQIFWLALTFAFLFVVLWRVAGPRIAGLIAERNRKMSDDLAAAQRNREEADAAFAGYEKALAEARARARAVAEESRKEIAAEVGRAKAAAETEALEATAKAETRISASRAEAAIHVTKAAQDGAAAIVARLTGDAVSADETAAAVRAVGGR